MNTHNTGFVASVNEYGTPHIATVYCLVAEDLTIYFITRVEARKFENMSLHPLVAMTFVDEKNMASVQLTGESERVESLSDEQSIMHQLMVLRQREGHISSPAMQLYEYGSSSEVAVMKVVPSELTYGIFQVTGKERKEPFFQKII